MRNNERNTHTEKEREKITQTERQRERVRKRERDGEEGANMFRHLSVSFLL